MKIRNCLILGLVLLGFTYCSSDEVLDGPTTGNEKAENLKMEITIQMPTGASTRSSTGGTPGAAPTTEVGTADENRPNSVFIVLVHKGGDNNGKIAGTYNSATVKDESGSTVGGDVSGATFFTTAQFTMTALTASAEFDVYAFVNPYNGLIDKYTKDGDFSKDAVFAASADQTTIKEVVDAVTIKKGESDRKNFFMSNANTVQTVTVNASHIQGAPLKVGVEVERAVARMDYVDRTSFPDGESAKTYTIPNAATVDGQEITVTFDNFKPMNASKSFYHLKRVGTGTGTDLEIGGKETAENYVVDTDWADKASSGFLHFMGGETTNGTYKEMSKNFYVTENTIPKADNVKKGTATAVVFKGKLTFDNAYTAVVTGSKSKYKPNDSNTSPVYVWNNKFYGTFDKLPQSIQNIVPLEEKDAISEDMIIGAKESLASAGVTGYTHEAEYGYPIYYVYYNRHNDNYKADVTGPMEFATVRNNIYKLTINSLSKFGHPNDPEDNDPKNPDPTPEKPEDDIESSTLYMQVTATVLDWTVRENNIEF